jgi:hypothetical protein
MNVVPELEDIGNIKGDPFEGNSRIEGEAKGRKANRHFV